MAWYWIVNILVNSDSVTYINLALFHFVLIVGKPTKQNPSTYMNEIYTILKLESSRFFPIFLKSPRGLKLQFCNSTLIS